MFTPESLSLKRQRKKYTEERATYSKSIIGLCSSISYQKLDKSVNVWLSYIPSWILQVSNVRKLHSFASEVDDKDWPVEKSRQVKLEPTDCCSLFFFCYSQALQNKKASSICWLMCREDVWMSNAVTFKLYMARVAQSPKRVSSLS